MDYSIANKTPDVAQAMVGHYVDASGNAVPQSAAAPQPVASVPRTFIVAAVALTRPANTTAYAAGDAVSNNATAASVTPISFAASDAANAPVTLNQLHERPRFDEFDRQKYDGRANQRFQLRHTGLHDSGRCGVRRKKVFFHQHNWSRIRYWRHSRRTADNVRSVTRTMNEAGAS